MDQNDPRSAQKAISYQFMKPISKAQCLYLQMIELGLHINNGLRIAEDLRSHSELWRSAIVTKIPKVNMSLPTGNIARRIDLSALWMLPDDCLTLDTLIIAPVIGRENSLKELSDAWKPAASVWISRQDGQNAMGANTGGAIGFATDADTEKFLLRLQWDQFNNWG